MFLALADIVVAHPDSQISFPEVRHGLLPALVSVACRRRVSDSALRHLMLTGEMIGAARAQDLGLVDVVCADMESCLKTLGDELQQVGHGHAARVKSLLPLKSIEEASLIMSQEASGEGTVWDSTSMELSCFWVRDNILAIDIKSRHLTENLWKSR